MWLTATFGPLWKRPATPALSQAARVRSVRGQHLTRRGVNMDDPESRRLLLVDHGDHTPAGRKKVVRRVMCLGRANLAFALEAEQDRLVGTGGHCHLVGAQIGITAVQGSGVFLVSQIV